MTLESLILASVALAAVVIGLVVGLIARSAFVLDITIIVAATVMALAAGADLIAGHVEVNTGLCYLAAMLGLPAMIEYVIPNRVTAR